MHVSLRNSFFHKGKADLLEIVGRVKYVNSELNLLRAKNSEDRSPREHHPEHFHGFCTPVLGRCHCEDRGSAESSSGKPLSRRAGWEKSKGRNPTVFSFLSDFCRLLFDSY